MSTTRRNSGFAIPAALFILLVLTVFGAAMVTMTTVSSEETVLDVQQTQALRAAQAGLEWGFYQTRVAASSSCSATGGENGLDAPTLAGFTVTVTCTPITLNEAGSPTLTRVTAVACNSSGASSPKCPGTAASAFYVERAVTGIVAR